MIKLNFIPAVLIAILFSSKGVADITLSPDRIEFRDESTVRKVIVKHDGKPVLPGEITKIASGVLKFKENAPQKAKGDRHFSNYSHMFDFRTDEEGAITITPNKGLLEIGSYILYVHTIHGTATGFIDANLRDQHPIAPHRQQESSAFVYEIMLPDYPYGAEISVNLNPDKKNTYSWLINGKEHSSGLGITSFKARLDVGTYEISFIVHNPEGDVISRWSDTTEVYLNK